MPSQMRIARLLKDNERIPIMRKQLQLESSAKAPNVAVKVNKKLLLTVQGFLFVWNPLKLIEKFRGSMIIDWILIALLKK